MCNVYKVLFRVIGRRAVLVFNSDLGFVFVSPLHVKKVGSW